MNADFTVAVDHGPKAIRTADTVVIPPFGAFNRPLSPDLVDRVAPLLVGMKKGQPAGVAVRGGLPPGRAGTP